MAFQSIFDFDHYPTPKSAIERMLQGVVVSGKIVLEPSAGAGNIVDYVKGIGASQVIAWQKLSVPGQIGVKRLTGTSSR